MEIKDLKTEKILIVDDNVKNIQILANILKGENYNIEFATSAKETLKWIEKADFDLILLDVMMPEMDGFELCQKIKKDFKSKEIPIIFLTAKADLEDILKGFEIGAVDYLTKPFNSLELFARIRNHLELKRVKDELKTMAVTDSLTGLFNHGFIYKRLKEEVEKAKRYDKDLSIMMLDIDKFKKINDNYGHQFGDKVLKKISAVIKSCIRNIDILGRYGGEEFLLVLPETELKAGVNVAERIREKIEEIAWDNTILKVTISGGITQIDKQDEFDFLKEADRLLYKAKENGRNKIEY